MESETVNQLLVAQVLTLAELLKQQAKANGVSRSGGDFTPDAVALIKAKAPAVLRLLAAAL